MPYVKIVIAILKSSASISIQTALIPASFNRPLPLSVLLPSTTAGLSYLLNTPAQNHNFTTSLAKGMAYPIILTVEPIKNSAE